jgi:hypothetical protein
MTLPIRCIFRHRSLRQSRINIYRGCLQAAPIRLKASMSGRLERTLHTFRKTIRPHLLMVAALGITVGIITAAWTLEIKSPPGSQHIEFVRMSAMMVSATRRSASRVQRACRIADRVGRRIQLTNRAAPATMTGFAIRARKQLPVGIALLPAAMESARERKLARAQRIAQSV